MKINFIADIAEKYPAAGRLVELSLISAWISCADLLIQMLETSTIDVRQFLYVWISTFLVTLIASFRKKLRDINKKEVE